MGSFADVFASVKLDLSKDEENKLQRRIGNIDSSKAGKQVATRFGVGFNGAFGGIISRSAGLFAAGFAAIKGAQVFGGFIKDAAESERISRITANAIRATGGAAKITASQVSDLATSISNKTAIDDEQIQAAANMLLTFKNIRNEAGKNNDIFNQATQAAADLSVQFGGIDGASKQLGKALNDPIKGTTALAKAGVTFTEQQKEQIKTLVKSGDTLGAQKIILKEIQGQVGGAAAAAADPMQRLKVIAGNVGEEIGGFLLPTVNRFAGFVSDKLLPGVKALVSFLRTGDFTTAFREAFNVEEDSRLVSFLLTARETVVSVFNEIKGGIVAFTAAWKYNDGQITSSGFPAFMEGLGFVARRTFDFFKAEVLPRLQAFAGVITGRVIPAITGFAGGIVKDKDVLIPLIVAVAGGVAVFKLVVGVIKAWTVAQALLNVVLTANPIGLVIVAIAALAAGLFIAYKKSETFREIVNSAFTVVKTTGSIMWTILKPILWAFGEAFKVVWERAQFFAKISIAAFNAIKEPAQTALRYVVDAFLAFVESILTGAAKAFGWVPELGGKLKTAASDFSKFRDDVNNKLAGIKDQDITIKPVFDKNTMSLASAGRRAMGGPIHGPGTGTSDTAGLFALSNGEHVWTAEEVRKAGGHAAMYRMRQAVRQGLAGFAAGGSPGFTVRAPMPNTSQFAREVAAHAVHIARPFAQQIAKQFMGPGGPPGSRQSFRGVTLNERTIRMLLAAERILGRVFRITQGSYSTSVSASGSTHAGGGAMDTNGPGGWNAAVNALRRSGFAAWHRTPSQGPWGHHIHSIAIGDPTASAAAKAQVRDFLRGGNGLRGMALGGHIGVFDKGGLLYPGRPGVNSTGQVERVLSPEQTAAFERLVATLEGRTGGTIHATFVDADGVMVGTMRGVIADENRKTARDYGLN